MSYSEQERDALLRVEQTIQYLYSGKASPADVVSIQTELQNYQSRNPFGWVLADHLLGSGDVNVRFFGALTFTVKINQQPLGGHDLSVLKQLLNWFVRCVACGESQLVLRKLSAALVTLFVQPSTRWRRPLRHLVTCVATGNVVAESSIEHDTPIEAILQSLNDQKLCALLSFATTLAQDASNIPHNAEYSSCHQRLEKNIGDVVALLRFMLACPLAQQQEFQKDVLDAYQAWISYTRAALSNSSDQARQLKGLLTPVMGHLLREDTFEDTAEFMIDLFTDNDDGFVSREHCATFAELFGTDWARSHLDSLVSDPSDEDLIFARLVLAFGQAMADKLVNDRESDDRIMDLMHLLTMSLDHRMIDQAVGGAICDFWDNYTVAVPVDDPANTKVQQVLTRAKGHWRQAIGELCGAAALEVNDKGEFTTLTSEHPMAEFRGRVRSTMQASYDDFGVLVLDGLVSTALKAYASAALHGGLSGSAGLGSLEVALYCLAELSTSMDYSVGHESQENALLEQLFGSQLYGALVDLEVPIPIRLRERAISTIADQEGYFNAHPDQLKSALEMMFKTIHIPQLTDRSTLAIRKLSDGGRSHLIPVILPLLDATGSFLQSDHSKNHSKRNLISAVGYIAQAMPLYSSEQLNVLTKLLTIIFGDPASKSNNPADGEEFKRYAVRTLENLAALGKALQVADKAPIYVLDDDEEEEDEDTSNATPAPLEAFNNEVLTALASLINPRDDGPLLEAACAVLSVGYKEQPPGYFHFSPSVSADLIASTPLSNPRLDEAIRTATNFLSSRHVQADKDGGARLRLTVFVADIVRALVTPQTDPELANYCVGFISRLIPLHIDCLDKLPPGYTELLFTFTLKALRSQDALPKRQASQLWNALVGMSSANGNPFIAGIVQKLGPELTRSLIFCFGGDATRTELDVLSRTFRKIRIRIPGSKLWAEQALAADDFPSQRATQDDKRRFMAQIMISRDDRTTEKIVKDFWVLCRGTPTGYT